MNVLHLTIHGALATFWAYCLLYAIRAIEHGQGDFLVCAVIFICGFAACAQLFLLLTEAEELCTSSTNA
jgi:hypothetical protein